MFVFGKKTVQTTMFSVICILLTGCGRTEIPQPAPDMVVQESEESGEEPLTQVEYPILEIETSENDISEEGTLFYKSEYKGTHPYVSGWRVDGSTGQSTPVYSTCGVSVNYYKTAEDRADGSGRDMIYTSEEIHSGCGK